jgi:hypothetical protein
MKTKVYPAVYIPYPLGYTCSVVRILKTHTYEAWFANCVTSKPAPELTFGLHDCPWEIPAMLSQSGGVSARCGSTTALAIGCITSSVVT